MIRSLSVGRTALQLSAARSMSTESSPFVQKAKELLLFNPNATPFITYADKGAGYRYPYPADRSPEAHVPAVENEDQVYNNQYYTRDTRRHGKYNKPVVVFSREEDKLKRQLLAEEKEKALLAAANGEEVEQEKHLTKGSPGNKSPAVLRYDETGTRSAMSTTWESTEALLAAAEPTHLPHYRWQKNLDKMVKECKDKNIPLPLGGTYSIKQLPETAW